MNLFNNILKINDESSISIDDFSIFLINSDVADDSYIVLPSVTHSGFGWIIAVDGSGNIDEATLVYLSGAGTATIFSSTADVVSNSSVDGKLCIGTAASQEPLRISNRLGFSRKLIGFFYYI